MKETHPYIDRLLYVKVSIRTCWTSTILAHWIVYSFDVDVFSACLPSLPSETSILACAPDTVGIGKRSEALSSSRPMIASFCVQKLRSTPQFQNIAEALSRQRARDKRDSFRHRIHTYTYEQKARIKVARSFCCSSGEARKATAMPKAWHSRWHYLFDDQLGDRLVFIIAFHVLHAHVATRYQFVGFHQNRHSVNKGRSIGEQQR